MLRGRVLSLVTGLFLTVNFGNLAFSEDIPELEEEMWLLEAPLCSAAEMTTACNLLEGCYMSNRDDPNIPGTRASQLIDWCMEKIGCLMRDRIDANCRLPFGVYANGQPVTGLSCHNSDIDGVGVRGPATLNVEVPSKAECAAKGYDTMSFIDPEL